MAATSAAMTVRTTHVHYCDVFRTELCDQTIPPLLGIALQAAGIVQRFQREHDFAAVLAAGGGHELFEIFRTVLQRGLYRGMARALVMRRLRDFGFELLPGADRHREIVARLGAKAAVIRQRRIERNRAERAGHDEIAVGLEARGE